MAKKLLKDIRDDNGNTKFDVDEIATLVDGEFKLLGELLQLLGGELDSNENGTYIKLSNGLIICYKVQQAGHGTRVNLPKTYTQNDYYIGIFPSENQITPGYNSSTVSGTGFSTRMYQGNSSVSNDSPIEVRVLTIGR